MLTGSQLILYFFTLYARCTNETGAEHVNKAPAVRQGALCREITRFL